jgi:hypothetical protein
MTLAEKLAAKRAAAAGGQSPAAQPSSLTIKRDPNGDDEYAMPAKDEEVGRRLAAVEESGEVIPMRHGEAAGDPGWRKACHRVEADLCVVIGPGPKDEAWLALAPGGRFDAVNPPLLLHRLPLVILPGSFEPF